LTILQIPCIFPILSCRLQLQLMVQVAALLFKLTPWDEGKLSNVVIHITNTVNVVKPIN
jgi:hypothetical protein